MTGTSTITEPRTGCGCGDSHGLERVRYFPRQLLAADDMRTEQEYFRQRQRRFNRLMMGWGVVCGLEVQADPKDHDVLIVCPGYALGPWGDEIYVPERVTLDLERCLVRETDPCVPRRAAPRPGTANAITAYVAIKYTECPSRPVRTTPVDCGCDETGCDYSRIRDGFALECLAELPASHQPPRPATALLPPCPPCSKEPWVILATLTIRQGEGTGGNRNRDIAIDNVSDRRVLAGAGVTLQPAFATAPRARGQAMYPGEVLWPGQPLESANGDFSFVYQRDGNLVLYDAGGPLWSSGTGGTAPGVCVMQPDGNLVVYDPTLTAYWSSGTWQYGGSRLVILDDGNVVILQGGQQVWETGTGS
jgi:hypothetical protein